jgi:hypothetical protein
MFIIIIIIIIAFNLSSCAHYMVLPNARIPGYYYYKSSSVTVNNLTHWWHEYTFLKASSNLAILTEIKTTMLPLLLIKALYNSSTKWWNQVDSLKQIPCYITSTGLKWKFRAGTGCHNWVLALLLWIWELLGKNLSPEIGYPDWDYVGFLSLSTQMMRQYLKLDDCFLPHPVQFIR